MRIKKYIIVALLFCSCQTKHSESGNSNDNSNQINLKDSTSQASTIEEEDMQSDSVQELEFKDLGDSLLVPEFEVQILLSSKTEELLKKNKESIIVDVHFEGFPIDTTSLEYMKNMGHIYFGNYAIELFDSRVAKFDNIKIGKDDYEGLREKDFWVNVGVWSGRLSSEFNLLSCNHIEMSISEIAGTVQRIEGKLIREK